jgi:hypothetical protein
MARRSLRPQLNQIRAWVRQGRTDAWIAHQLEISASELREFRRQHDLNAEEDDPSTSEIDLRDEIEAEIEAATAEEAEEAEESVEEEDGESDGGDDDDSEDGAPRRRRRRGRRGRRRRRQDMEATFDHGEEEGYGLWLDPSVQDNNVYTENWKGHRAVTVTIEPDRIVIRRVEADTNGASASSDEPASTDEPAGSDESPGSDPSAGSDEPSGSDEPDGSDED